ncbi:hypothetical protein FND50_25030 [Rhodococcus sp. WB9]|nr:hypothetical protein FND50_25030 [Rhodococcus sp. WB9]
MISDSGHRSWQFVHHDRTAIGPCRNDQRFRLPEPFDGEDDDIIVRLPLDPIGQWRRQSVQVRDTGIPADVGTDLCCSRHDVPFSH